MVRANLGRGEAELVNKYLFKFHRKDPQWKRVRLGPLPAKELARMYMVGLRWADAIVIKDNVVIIIEAKLKPNAGALGQLDLYEQMFRQTTEFSNFWEYPIEKVLVTPVMDTIILEEASRKNIRYEMFEPDEWKNLL